MKPQNDVIRRLDFVLEPSFDNNKNYTKNTNNMINGTKVNKKLSLNDESDARKSRKSWRIHLRNGMIAKSKRRRNLWRKGKKGAELSLNVADEEEDEFMGSDSSHDKTSLQDNKRNIDNDAIVENITEPIKKKKGNTEKKMSKFIEVEPIMSKKTAIKKTLSERRDGTSTTDRISLSSQDNGKFDDNCISRGTKRQRMDKISRSNMKNVVKSDIATNSSKMVMSGLRKSARNSAKVLSKIDDHESSDTRNKANKFNYDSPPESCDETETEYVPKNTVNKFGFSDEEMIEEQQRIERLLLQEREDFELAQRLQAQFDEMERIAGRTRRSRQVTENARCTEASLCEFNVAKTVSRPSGARKTAQRNPTVNGTANAKRKRGRPPKRMKITLNACENETRTR
jgi:hypothetical protein